MRAQKKRPESPFVIKFLLWHFWHFGTFSLDSANSANSAMRFFYARRHICAVKRLYIAYILLNCSLIIADGFCYAAAYCFLMN